MNRNGILCAVLTLITAGSAVSALGQTTVYENSRYGNNSTGTRNPDFTTNGAWSVGAVASKSTAPGLSTNVSSSTMFVATPAPAGTSFTVTPSGTNQLVNGTTYAVAITFCGVNGASAEGFDISVTTTDTGVINDTFAGTTTSFAEQRNGNPANNGNTWIPIGNVTVNSASPTFTFKWSSGSAGARWYLDAVQFTPLPTPQYWAPGGSPGGTGTWDTTSMNWNSKSDGTGTQHAYIQGDLATFGAAAGIVTIPSGGITTDGGVEFDVDGYTVTGGPLALGSGPTTPGTNVTVLFPGTAATIASLITATNGVSLNGLGTLNVTSNQTFSSLGGIGGLNVGADTLTVGGNNANTTYAGEFSDENSSGAVALIKEGSGTLTFGNVVQNAYFGKTVINAGTLAIPNAAFPLGGTPGSPVADMLTLNGVGHGACFYPIYGLTFDANRGITVTGTSNIFTSVNGIVFNNSITGSGGVVILGGSINFNTPNDFAGDLVFALTNFANVRFNVDNCAGQGTIRIAPQSESPALYGGPTKINIRQPSSPTVSVTITNPVVFDESVFQADGYSIDTSSGGTFTLSGNFSGTAKGGVNVNDASNGRGTVVLSGNNSAFSGGFNLQGGILSLGSSTALGSGTFALTATASSPASSYQLQAVSSLTGVNAVATPVRLTVPSGFIFANGNALELSGPITLAPSSGTTLNIENDNSGGTILSGSIGQAAAGTTLTLSGSGGTLTLNAANTYSGGAVVNSGTVDAAAECSLPGNVTVNGGTLVLDNCAAMCGNGALKVNSPGQVQLNCTGYLPVGALYLNGVAQGVGTYGANGSTITGAGHLVVVPSPFIITSAASDGTGTNFVVCWQSVPNVPYEVMTNSSVTAGGAWVSAGTTNASGTNTCFTLPGGIQGNHSVFVRIKVP